MGQDAKSLHAEELVFGLSQKILDGATLDEVLDHLYETFSEHLPYERVGFALVDKKANCVTARWAKSSCPILLGKGYKGSLEGSSLSIVLEKRKPRVLNNLREYLSHRPKSHATRLMVNEGLNSSMTCPLFLGDYPLAFLFFSSTTVNAYSPEHVALMRLIAMQLTLLLVAAKDINDSDGDSDSQTWSKIQSAVSPADGNETKNKQTDRKSDELLLSQLRPRQTLLRSVYTTRGTLLLKAGSQLTPSSIEQLKQLRGSLSTTKFRVADEDA